MMVRGGLLASGDTSTHGHDIGSSPQDAPGNGGDSCCVSPWGKSSVNTVSRGSPKHPAAAATVAGLFSA